MNATTRPARSYKMERPEQKRLGPLFAALMRRLGAVRRTDFREPDPYRQPLEFELHTTVGPLRIGMGAEISHGPGCHGDWIYARFGQPKLAAKKTGCCEYTGKWNRTYGVCTADEVVQRIEAELRPILVR